MSGVHTAHLIDNALAHPSSASTSIRPAEHLSSCP